MTAQKPPWGLGRTGLLLAAVGQVALALLALLRIVVDGEDHWWNWAVLLVCVVSAVILTLAQRRQASR